MLGNNGEGLQADDDLQASGCVQTTPLTTWRPEVAPPRTRVQTFLHSERQHFLSLLSLTRVVAGFEVGNEHVEERTIHRGPHTARQLHAPSDLFYVLT